MQDVSKREFDKDVKFYEVYRDYVKHEDTITGQRVGWMLTIQSFLFAAYGISANVPSAADAQIRLFWLHIILIVFGSVVASGFAFSLHNTNKILRHLSRSYNLRKQNLDETYGNSSTKSVMDRLEIFPDLRWAGLENKEPPFGASSALALLILFAWLGLLLLELRLADLV